MAPSAEESSVRERGAHVVVPSFDFRIDYCAATIAGGSGEHNEDALLCRPALGLFAIADGMGGHAAGEVAARVSLDVVAERLAAAPARGVLDRYAAEPEIENRRALYQLLAEAMRAANDAVIQAGTKDASQQGMGTTLDLVLLVRDRAFFAHVGDARAYLVRPTVTLQITHDHAAYDSLRISGKRTATQRFAKSPLTNSIGHRRRLVVDTLFVDLAAGDRIVLCTDGVYGVVDTEASFARLCKRGDAEAACRQLVGTARMLGTIDDASAIVVGIADRFVKRRGDAGPRARDLATLGLSPLFVDLSAAEVLSALAAGVEVELDEGEEVPRAVANDRVAYVVLEGQVELAAGRRLGPAGLLMAESLLDVVGRGKLPRVVERTRLLRIRHDDFREVCSHNTQLAAELYRRIARHLATLIDG